MNIQKTAQDAYRMVLSPAEATIFINCMNETLAQIPAREYQTRMGVEATEIRSMITSLQTALK